MNNPEEIVIRLDIKAIGGRIGRRINAPNFNIPNKPGKKPKDGDGDGFVIDPRTGLDNKPVEDIFDGVDKDWSPDKPKRPTTAEEAEKYAQMLERDARNAPIDGNTERHKKARIARRFAEYKKRGGRQEMEEWSSSDRGRNPNDYPKKPLYDADNIVIKPKKKKPEHGHLERAARRIERGQISLDQTPMKPIR